MRAAVEACVTIPMPSASTPYPYDELMKLVAQHRALLEWLLEH